MRLQSGPSWPALFTRHRLLAKALTAIRYGRVG